MLQSVKSQSQTRLSDWTTHFLELQKEAASVFSYIVGQTLQNALCEVLTLLFPEVSLTSSSLSGLGGGGKRGVLFPFFDSVVHFTQLINYKFLEAQL